jgi:hypothetical protein
MKLSLRELLLVTQVNTAKTKFLCMDSSPRMRRLNLGRSFTACARRRGIRVPAGRLNPSRMFQPSLRDAEFGHMLAGLPKFSHRYAAKGECQETLFLVY